MVAGCKPLPNVAIFRKFAKSPDRLGCRKGTGISCRPILLRQLHRCLLVPSFAQADSGSFSRSSYADFTFISYAFVGVTILSIFVPLNPRMPASGLDPSWEFAMNQVVARHMHIGKDIVFTYGPYAALITRIYDPATDVRMMLSSLVLGACFGCALLFVARGRKRRSVIALLLFLAIFGNIELLLLSYAFLLVLCVLEHREAERWSRWLGRGSDALAVGGGSSDVVGAGAAASDQGQPVAGFLMSVAVGALVALYRFGVRLAIALAAIPLASAVLLWMLGGQAIGDLPAYLRGVSWLTAGYTEALATGWGALPAIGGDVLVAAFIAVSALACYAIGRCDRLPLKARAYLIALCTVLFFIVFKHGFLEPSGMSASFATLSALIFILALVFPGKRMAWPLIIAIAITTATSVLGEGGLEQQVHERFGIGTAFSGQKNQQKEILAFCIQRALPAYGRRIFVHGWETYESAFEGLLLRAHGEAALRARFADAVDNIRRMKPVPQLTGTVDEYEEEQSALLVSANRWDPRPEFLSYSAYTPELAEMNEQHLRGAQAPDWVLFHLESIQNRLPTLDDGMSWPALLDNYTFSANYGQFVLLHRNHPLRSASSYQTIETAVHRIGEKVELPNGPGLFFAQVVLKPTVAGKAMLVLLNPPQLRIVLNLENGQTRSYRVIAKMMTTGFLLSPAVSNDAEFTSLMTGSDAAQEERVRSFSIEPTYGGSIFWSRAYGLTLKQYAK